jgi:hypothetical protein
MPCLQQHIDDEWQLRGRVAEEPYGRRAQSRGIPGGVAAL